MALSKTRKWITSLSEQVWPRHANPWSVVTRFAAIPAMIMAVWSREWLEWWSLLPIGMVVVWLAINPFAFSRIEKPVHWISKGIFGERLWLTGACQISNRSTLRVLVFLGVVGIVVMAWGLYAYNVTACALGAIVTTVAQLVRIALFARIYDVHSTSIPAEKPML
jgi:hypothetical protein